VTGRTLMGAAQERGTAMNEHRERVLRDLVQRVESEYLEMPGLSLTPSQAQRILGLDQPTCHDVLAELTANGFLRRTQRGTYVREASI